MAVARARYDQAEQMSVISLGELQRLVCIHLQSQVKRLTRTQSHMAPALLPVLHMQSGHTTWRRIRKWSGRAKQVWPISGKEVGVGPDEGSFIVYRQHDQ